MNQTEQQSKQKFITLMRNLIPHINENPAHQLTIYQCLNTEQIKRLFQSLHDHSKVLRLTALIFVCKLLYNSPQIVDTLLLRDNCDLTMKKNGTIGTTVPIQKYIITGLGSYRMESYLMAQIVNIINNKVKYRKNILFWYVEIANKSIGYFGVEDELQDTEIDPKTHIIGIFVGETQTGRQTMKSITSTPSNSLIRKNIPDSSRTKYTISKAGYFSSGGRKG